MCSSILRNGSSRGGSTRKILRRGRCICRSPRQAPFGLGSRTPRTTIRDRILNRQRSGLVVLREALRSPPSFLHFPPLRPYLSLFFPTLHQLRPRNYSGFHPWHDIFQPPTPLLDTSHPLPILLHLILPHPPVSSPRFRSSQRKCCSSDYTFRYVFLLPLLPVHK